jgi:hypothetical protein
MNATPTLPLFLLTLALLASAPVAAFAAGCDTRIASVSGADPALYSPFSSQPINAPFVLELTGVASSTVHVRFAEDHGANPKASVMGRAGSGELEVLSGSPGSFPANAATLSRWWAPVTLDAGGRGTLGLTLMAPPGQISAAGDWLVPLSLRLACSDGNGGYEEQAAIAFAPRRLRILPEIGSVGLEKTVLDLGPIPRNNPEGWNNGQSTELLVVATAPFQVRLVNQELRLRNVGAATIGPVTSIPYDLQIDRAVLKGAIGGRRSVTCWRPGAHGKLQTRVELAPLLPANAAANRVAGRYRDEIILSVEPLELALPDAPDGSCQ